MGHLRTHIAHVFSYQRLPAPPQHQGYLEWLAPLVIVEFPSAIAKTPSTFSFSLSLKVIPSLHLITRARPSAQRQKQDKSRWPLFQELCSRHARSTTRFLDSAKGPPHPPQITRRRLSNLSRTRSVSGRRA